MQEYEDELLKNSPRKTNRQTGEPIESEHNEEEEENKKKKKKNSKYIPKEHDEFKGYEIIDGKRKRMVLVKEQIQKHLT